MTCGRIAARPSLARRRSPAARGAPTTVDGRPARLVRAQIAGRRIRRSEGGEATGEEVAVGGVAGQLQARGVLGAGLVRPVEPAQQVRPGRRQQVEAGQPRSRPPSSASPAAGPSTSATATARFSRTTGEPVQLLERRVERGDPGPVRLRRRRPPGVLGGDRRLQQVRPGAPATRRRPQQRRPFGDLRGVPAGPVLVRQQHQPAGSRPPARPGGRAAAAAARAARPPPARPASARPAPAASRIASSHRSRRTGASPEVAACPSVKTR